MGFRTNAWATVWSVEPSAKGSSTKVRLSTSRKNKDGGYEQDFSGFCLFIGKAHVGAANLVEKDRIKLGDCEVTTMYDKTKSKEYVNYKVYEFTTSDDQSANGSSSMETSNQNRRTAFEDIIEDGESNEDKLPF